VSVTDENVQMGIAGRQASGNDQPPAAPVPLKRRLRRWFYHRLLRLMMLAHNTALFLAKRLGPKPRQPRDGEGYEILLTGRFESENWAAAHLRPLAMSRHCSRLLVVSTYPLSPMAKVEVAYPPSWLVRLVGATAARLLLFAWLAVRQRPGIIGGFHIAGNALAAICLAPLVGARSVYFCVGGPTEVIDGGVAGEGGPFRKMETPDPVVEARLLRAIAECDLTVTMGTRAADFFRAHGACNVHVISGGIDDRLFKPLHGDRGSDLILVGRLVEIKRINLFLHAVALAAKSRPDITAAIVGEGPQRPALEQLARDLGIAQRVRFAGLQQDVGAWLNGSKIFVLTSRSEGLSLSLMEAMLCGLPAVVSNVGDLGDIVKDGANGYLVGNGSPDTFAARFVDILGDPGRYSAFSHAARREALRYKIHTAVSLWDDALARNGTPGIAAGDRVRMPTPTDTP